MNDKEQIEMLKQQVAEYKEIIEDYKYVIKEYKSYIELKELTKKNEQISLIDSYKAGGL
jgi:hypothetical protein